MSRNQLIILAICLLSAASGCRNACNNACKNGWFAGTPTIAAPPTYSLNIPSVARNQPYYVPGTNSVAPNTNSPTPATSPSLPNRWEPKTGNVSGSTGGSSQGSTGQSVLSAPTTFVETSPNNPGAYRTASNTSLPGTGISYTDSTNYRTTQVDETRDNTRLPATDASTVRAPASNFPGGNVNRIAQLPQPTAPRYPATFNSTASSTQPYVPPQNGIAYNGANQPIYLATPVATGNRGFQSTPVYGGQATGQPVYYGVPYNNSSPTVLAQASTSYDPATGSQFGWRDRELNTSNDSLNR